MPCKLLASVLDPARTAAAIWNGRHRLVAQKREEKLIFSSAKLALALMPSKGTGRLLMPIGN